MVQMGQPKTRNPLTQIAKIGNQVNQVKNRPKQNKSKLNGKGRPMDKVKRIVAALMIIMVGLLIFCYPSIASFVNDFTANREVAEYNDRVSAYDEEELAREMAMALAYNQSLPGGYPADPFSGSGISDFTGTEFEYFDMVQPGAMIGYIEIPAIDIYLPVYYGTSNEVLDTSLGLVERTSLPVGGPGTHAVISGHSGMASRKLFTDLNQMKEEDIFFIHVLNQHFAYQVDQIKVVLPTESEELLIQEGQDYVTLLTCTPFGINDHRLLVRGTRIDYDFTEEPSGENFVQKAAEGYMRHILEISVVAGALLMILLILFINRRRQRKEKTDASEN